MPYSLASHLTGSHALPRLTWGISPAQLVEGVRMRITEKQTQLNAKKRQRGAALVETALVFTVTLGMILFIVDMGRVLLMQQYVTERARVAVRNAVVNNWDSTAVANYVAYASATAPSGGGPGFLGLTPSELTSTTYADSGI